MTLAEYMNGQFTLWQNLDFFARIAIACLCGACIGFERSKRLKEAGVRTHIIVCCAAALMMVVSKYGFADLTDLSGAVFNGTRGADPARIAAQVVSGISFLGAGVIFKIGNTVKGLTTAAGIWATAGIGLAIGSGMYIIGFFATGLIALIQIMMHKFTIGADALSINHLTFTAQNSQEFYKHFSEYIAVHKIQVAESKISFNEDGTATYDMILRASPNVSMQELDFFIASTEGVQSVSYTPGA